MCVVPDLIGVSWCICKGVAGSGCDSVMVFVLRDGHGLAAVYSRAYIGGDGAVRLDLSSSRHHLGWGSPVCGDGDPIIMSRWGSLSFLAGALETPWGEGRWGQVVGRPAVLWASFGGRTHMMRVHGAVMESFRCEVRGAGVCEVRWAGVCEVRGAGVGGGEGRGYAR